MIAESLLVLIGSLMAAAGIGLLAAAAHGTMPTLGYAAQMLLFHGVGLVAVTAACRGGLIAPRLGRLGGIGLALGASLFSADVTLAAFTGGRLFPMAAPAGGVLAIGGWLMIGAAALLAMRRRA